MIERHIKSTSPVQVLADGTVVVATNTVHGPTQVRCSNCHGMCAPSRSASGAAVMRCSSCRTESVGRRI